MKTYLLNTPVLTSFGRFDFQPITLEDAKVVLAEGFDSAVGHASTAEALTTLLGLEVRHRRVTIAMQPGDRAVVFRLLERPAEGEVLSREKVLACQHEWGLLEAKVAEMDTSRTPCSRVFISYDRNNEKFAQQLHRDLMRAGLSAWLDREGIAPDDPRWRTVVEAEICRSDLVILLASPESAKSKNVAKELTVAENAKRRVARLLVGGKADELPPTWQEGQLTDFCHRAYGEALREFFQWMWPDLAVPDSLLELLTDPEFQSTATDAARRLGMEAQPRRVEDVTYVTLPLSVSGYTATDLLVPAEERLVVPEALRLFVHTTQDVVDKESMVLKDAIAEGRRPWLLYLRGHVPKGEKKYGIPFESPHIWEDTAEAVMRCLHGSPFRERRVDIYFNGPAALAFEIGSRNRHMGVHDFFAYDGANYRRVDWPRGNSPR